MGARILTVCGNESSTWSTAQSSAWYREDAPWSIVREWIMVVLLTMAKIWNQAKCPPVDEGVKECDIQAQ
jgi:hypothetical protein